MFGPDFIFACLYGMAVVTAVGVLLSACVTDFYTMTIPNILPIVLAVAFFVAYGAAWGISQNGGEMMFAPLKIHAMAFGVMLVVTFLMFAFGVWGAGIQNWRRRLPCGSGLPVLCRFLLRCRWLGWF